MNTPEDGLLDRALELANPGALRIALYWETKDPELAAMTVEERPTRGGALSSYVLADDDQATVRSKARAYLAAQPPLVTPPTVDEAAVLMEMFTGKPPTDAQKHYGYEELAYAEFPRNAEWTNERPDEALADFSVTIIGAGFSGVAAGVQLSRLGIPYRIIERHAGIGGTWFVNDYPEARCDIPSYVYSYKFDKAYAWKSYFAPQAELKDYLQYIADTYGVSEHITCSTELTNAAWDEDASKWVLDTIGPDGASEQIVTNAVISGSGTFHAPKLPDIKGIDDFQGPIFHTTQWDHSYDYTGKRVALVGTGSTGSQLARDLGLKAEQLTIYQRTANWITPIGGYHDHVPEEVHWLFDTLPGYRKWYVYTNYVAELQVQRFQELDHDWIAQGGRVNEKNAKLAASLTEFIRYKVNNRDDLVEKLIPTHPPLARRLVIDNQWYDTVQRDNVELVHGGVTEITPTGAIDDQGDEREFDMIVLAAGFKVSQYLWPVSYTGRNDTSLEDLWATDGARAFKGMALPNFPNFFMLYGPNSQLRIGSFHSWVEILSRYISQLLVDMIESGHTSIEIGTQAYERYNADLDVQMAKMLWEHEKGGGGYYVNEHGRSGINMPWEIHDFYELVATADTDSYVLR